MTSTKPAVSRVQLEHTLNVILMSPIFSRAGRSAELLKYLVKHSLDNQIDKLTESTIGVEVFGRDSGFTPNSNNIVRVNAGRLRQKLADFYASPEGTTQRVQITLPERSYEPQFLIDDKVVEPEQIGASALPTAPVAAKTEPTLVEVATNPSTLSRLHHSITAFTTVPMVLLVVLVSVLVSGLYLSTMQDTMQNTMQGNAGQSQVQQSSDNPPGLSAKLLGDSNFQGDYIAAHKHYQQAVTQTPNNSVYLRQLARCQLQLSEYEAAKDNLQSALKLDRIGQSNSAQIAQNLLYLGAYYSKTSQFTPANRHLNDAFDMALNLDVAANQLMAYYSELASNHFRQGQYSQAQDQVSQALALATQQAELPYENMAALYSTRGLVKQVQGQFTKAAIDLHTALDLDIARYGEQHEKVAVRRNNLGILFGNTGQYGQALTQYQTALVIFEKIYGEKHSLVAKAYNNIGLALTYQKKNNDAHTHLAKSMSIHIALYSNESPQVASNLFNIGEVYFQQGQIEQAQSVYQRALTLFTDAFGPQHLHVGLTLEALGNVYVKHGQTDKAQALYTQALPIFNDTYGPEHALSLKVQQLAKVLDDDGLESVL
ncbi:MAG: tetratricopeptide (TPR) repeat protein [Phenylobacterium sp.]|jgi:tetratricopeptide (TPR) repeat protein